VPSVNLRPALLPLLVVMPSSYIIVFITGGALLTPIG
jgi:hypothetical protein